MKKKLSIILLLLVTFITTNVHAEDTWPKQYTKGDFSFTITDVTVGFAWIDKNDPELPPGTTDTAAGSTISTSTKSLINYVDGYSTGKIIDIPSDRFTINPEPIETKLLKTDTLIYKMNLNISSDYILEAYNELAEPGYIYPVSEDIIYIVDVCVLYNLDSYPEKYKTIYEVDSLRNVLSMYSTRNRNIALKVNPEEYYNSFVIDKMIVKYNKDTGQAEVGLISDLFDYLPETIYNSKSELLTSNELLKMDSLAFYEDEDATLQDPEDYKIILTNTTDVNGIINTINGKLDDHPNNQITSIQTETIENIPNTGQGTPYILYVISATIILVGGAIIVKY